MAGEVLPLSYGKALPAKRRASGGGCTVFGSSGPVGTHDEPLVTGPAIIVGRKGSAGSVHFSRGPSWPIDTAYYSLSSPDCDLRYGYHVLSWLRLDRLDQSTAIPSLSRDSYNQLPVPLPPVETQRRIIARIEELFAELDDGEAALARAWDDLKTYRKSLLKAAVTGELTADWREANPMQETGEQRLQRIVGETKASGSYEPKNRGKSLTMEGPSSDELSDLPETWTWASIGLLGVVSGGVTKNAKRSDAPIFMPYLRVANVYADRLDLRQIEKIGIEPSELPRVALQPNDLLIVEGNGSIDQIGRCAIWDGSIEPCVHQNHLIKVRFEEGYLARWCSLWLRSPLGRREMEQQASSTSGLHTLSISKVSNVRVPIGPEDELRLALSRAEGQIDDGRDCLAALDRHRQDGAALRQAILHSAFRGELIQ